LNIGNIFTAAIVLRYPVFDDGKLLGRDLCIV